MTRWPPAGWGARPELPEPRPQPAAKAPNWDAYEHLPTPVQVARGARQVGLVNPQVVVSKCACGGEVVITRPDSEDDATAAVAAHYGTLEHQRWRQAQGVG